MKIKFEQKYESIDSYNGGGGGDMVPLDLLQSYFNRVKGEVRPKKSKYMAAEMVALTTQD